MATSDPHGPESGIVLRSKPWWEITRLPPVVAIPLIGVLSLPLWIALFRLFALLF
jgi:hypothetical protein